MGTLYGSVGQSDAAPTEAQVNAAADADRNLSTVMKRWEGIKKSDLPTLNQQLKNANLPEIRLDSKAPTEEADSDVE